jgi:predicted CoA-binding protein
MAKIVETEEGIAEIVRRSRRVAVLGIKPESHSGQPAFYVPQYLQTRRIEMIPVPVYFPNVTEILGQKVYRTLAAIPLDLDLVDVFRRPEDIDAHVDDLIAKKPKAVWFQLGIRNDAVAHKLVFAGIDVVQDRCLMVEHRRHA